MTGSTSPKPRLLWLLPGLLVAFALTASGGRLSASGRQTTTAKPPSSAPQTTVKPTVAAPAGQTQPQPTTGQRPGGPPGLRLGPQEVAFKWWKDDAVKKEIGLDEQQASRIDRTYESRIKDMDLWAQKWEKEWTELTKMTRERIVDVGAYEYQVGQFEAANTKISASRRVMLYRMYLVLKPDQYQKLSAIFERNRGRRGGGGPH